MGMLLRHRPDPDEMTTTETMRKPISSQETEKSESMVADSVKKEKPKTVKRGRPTIKK